MRAARFVAGLSRLLNKLAGLAEQLGPLRPEEGGDVEGESDGVRSEW